MGNHPSTRSADLPEDRGMQNQNQNLSTPRLTPDAFLQMHEFQRLLVQRNLLSQQFQQQQQAAAPLITARTYKPSYYIHKESFALYEGSPDISQLMLRFEFDAQRPCIVKVFYVAVELLSQGGSKKPLTERLFTKLLKKGESPISAADTRRYNAGTRLVFDQRISPGTSSSSSLNLRQYSLEELSHIPKSTSAFWGSTHQPSISSLSLKALNSLTEIQSQRSIGCDIDVAMRMKSVPSMMSPLVIVIEDDFTSTFQTPQSGEQQLSNEHESYSYFGCFTGYEGRVDSLMKPPVLGVLIFQERLQLGETVYFIKELYGSVSNTETSSGPTSGAGGALTEGDIASSSSNVKSSSSPIRPLSDNNASSNVNESNSSSSSSSSSPGAVTSGSADIIDGAECVICLTERRTTIVMPCRHLCLCTSCAEDLRLVSNTCPVCRGPVARFLAIDTPIVKASSSP